MEVLTKTAPIDLGYKVLDDHDEPGTFEAYVAVFGNVDLGGERIIAGAFAKTIAEWEARGTKMPFMLHHNTFKLEIGAVETMVEDDIGLKVKVRLFVDDSDCAEARNLYASMRANVHQEFSIGYSVVDAKAMIDDEERVLDLLELRLYESSKVFIGMNPETRLLDVKSNVVLDSTSESATVRNVQAMMLSELELSL